MSSEKVRLLGWVLAAVALTAGGATGFWKRHQIIANYARRSHRDPTVVYTQVVLGAIVLLLAMMLGSLKS
jgi:hypothetical protein